MSTRLKGVHTIMPTPFKPDGDVDLDSVGTLTNFLANLDVDGVVVLGVLGEAPKLSEQEQADVVTVAVDAAAGRIPIFAGAGADGTDLAIRKGSRAVELGAAGLLVAPPPVQSDSVILEYYRRIGRALDSMIILHDYPATTGIRMSADLVVDLFNEVSQVQVIKLEDPPTGPKISALRDAGCEISVVGGLGGMYFLEELDRGADGMMTGFSYPDILKRIYTAYTSGNKSEAARIFYEACPLLRYEFQPGVGLALRKEIYRRRGAISSAYVRHPGAQIDARLIEELDGVLSFCSLELPAA